MQRNFSLATRRQLLLGLGGIAFVSTAAFALLACGASPPSFVFPDAAAISAQSAPASSQAQGTMVTIRGGSYPIGAKDGARDHRPEHRVELPAFLIDKTEVTNAAFAEFLNALPFDLARDFAAGEIGERDVADGAVDLLREGREGSPLYPIIALDDDQARIGGQAGRFLPTPGYEDHPVTETTWAGARAYCAWRGARLPTEVEWEAAARGPEGRLYPWGNEEPTSERVSASGRSGETAPVGSRPAGASPSGLLDLAGSLAEWTSSLKRPYPYDPNDGRESADAAGERVTRGGDYIYDAGRDELTAFHRDGFSNAPERGHRHIGFRCARSSDSQ